jgi:hypothetical protein
MRFISRSLLIPGATMHAGPDHFLQRPFFFIPTCQSIYQLIKTYQNILKKRNGTGGGGGGDQEAREPYCPPEGLRAKLAVYSPPVSTTLPSVTEKVQEQDERDAKAERSGNKQTRIRQKVEQKIGFGWVELARLIACRYKGKTDKKNARSSTTATRAIRL